MRRYVTLGHLVTNVPKMGTTGVVLVCNFAGNYWWTFQEHCHADER